MAKPTTPGGILAALAGIAGSPTRRVLGRADFTAGSYNAGILSKLAYWRVPPSNLAFIVGNIPIRLLVRGHHQFTAAGGSPEVFDMSANGFTSGIAQNPAGDATSVIALINSAVATPTAISYSAGTVSLDTTAGQTVDIYALPLDGHLEFRVTPPGSGMGSPASPQVFAQPFSHLNTVSQADMRYAPKFDAPYGELPLGGLFNFELYAYSPVTIDWSSAYSADMLLHAVMFRGDPNAQGVSDFIMGTFYG